MICRPHPVVELAGASPACGRKVKCHGRPSILQLWFHLTSTTLAKPAVLALLEAILAIVGYIVGCIRGYLIGHIGYMC